MTKYYFRADKTTYCEGPINEMPDGAIETEQMPSWNHIYDFDNSVWVQDLELTKRNIRYERDEELKRTDHFFLTDSSLTAEDKVIGMEYRQALRDVPNHENVEEVVMPDRPICLIK